MDTITVSNDCFILNTKDISYVFVIDKYNETCNGYSDRPLKDKDLCIYADAKAYQTTIKSILDK